MRATTHYARGHKDGKVFNPKHNDRSYSHQDPTAKRTWYAGQDTKPGMTFEDHEKRFYDKFFSAHLQAENDKKRAGGHASRVIDMDAYRKSIRTCPEEELVYIGNSKEGHADLDTLWKIAVQQINWETKKYPDCVILDMALHQEAGAPHIHIRRVWMANDGHGSWCVSQRKSLAQMVVKPPDPTKPIGRFNNAKQTYTQDCREHFKILCREHGFTIEDQPRTPSKKSLELLEYKVQVLQKTAASWDVKELRAELESMTQQRNKAVHEGAAYRKAYDKALETLRHVRPDLVRELMSAVDDSIKKRAQDKTR